MGSRPRISLDVIQRTYFPHSLGLLYLAITQYLGFGKYGDEFKVMGLAPYGEPTFSTELEQLVRLLPEGGFELDPRYFRHWSDGARMTWEDGEPTHRARYSRPSSSSDARTRQAADEPVTPRHEAMAASLQVVFEERNSTS